MSASYSNSEHRLKKAVNPESIAEALEKNVLSRTAFAMGCFWDPDSFFGSLTGVVQTRVGYAGSSSHDPSYGDIKGHAETLRIYFDASIITYEQLLTEFSNRFQPGVNYGQYRSIIFPANEDQEKAAKILSLA
jgi:peptide methionine sulfoxide reductase MsrA